MKKWCREHIAFLILLGAIPVCLMLLFIALNRTYLLGLAALAGLIEYGYQNNQIMIYVEHKLYD